MKHSSAGESPAVGPSAGDDHAQMIEAIWCLPVALTVTRAIDGVFRAANSAFEALSGFALAELVGHGAVQLGIYGDRARPDWSAETHSGLGAAQCEWTLRTKSGALRRVLASVRRLRFGGEACLITSLVDITEREQARERLRETEEWYRRLVRESADPMFVAEWEPAGCGGRYLEVNESAVSLLGWSREELLRISRADLVASDDPLTREDVRRQLESGERVAFERTVVTKDGRRLQVEVHGNLLVWRGARRLVSQWRDVTARRSAERALLEAKETFERLAEVAPVGIYRMDPSGHVRYANPAALRLIGRSREDLAGRHFSELVAEGDHVRVAERWREVIAGGPPIPLEARIIRPSGEILWYLTQAQRVVGPDGVTEVVGSVADISEQHAVAAALAVLVEAATAAGGFLPHVVAQVAPAIDMDYAGIVLDGGVSSAPVKVLAWWRDGELLEDQLVAKEAAPGRELAGETACMLTSGCADRAPRTVAEWAPGAIAAGLVPLCDRGGRRLGYLCVFGRRPVASASVLRRVLEFVAARCAVELERMRESAKLSRIEEHLVRSQKLQALGTFAGGIAHDFNNVLTAMINYTTLAREVAAETERQGYLEQVIAAGQRARDLVRQILAFSRPQADVASNKGLISLATVVDETLSFLKVAIPSSIKLQRVVDLRTPSVWADSRQMHQVMLNLGVNASHAVGSGPGLITFDLAPCELDEVSASMIERVAPGLHARLRVTDSGCGMDEETMKRIFDPYFTTKPEGEGTGLGLAIVWSILEEHRAGIRVQSQPGKGTTFELYFPAAKTEAPTGGACSSSRDDTAKARSRRVLMVVGSDPRLRARSGDLAALGYRVSVFAHAVDALAELWIEPKQFDLVVAPQHMPDLSGSVLVKRIRTANARIPILLSGVDQADEDVGTETEGVWRLPRELSSTEFAQEVSRRCD